jgi:hypothetical protein
MVEHEFPFESFIGGWCIPNNICDDLIKLFHFAKEKGHTIPGTQKHCGKVEIDKDVKDSEELRIKWDSKNSIIINYRNQLQKVLDNYVKRYSTVYLQHGFNVNVDYNLQYYKPGGGFKIWHNERANIGEELKRILVFMTYLNDVDDGGTEFKNQNIICPAKKGLTLIWPTDWTHTHRGQVSYTKEKYIVTGWFTFNEQ